MGLRGMPRDLRQRAALPLGQLCLRSVEEWGFVVCPEIFDNELFCHSDNLVCEAWRNSMDRWIAWRADCGLGSFTRFVCLFDVSIVCLAGCSLFCLGRGSVEPPPATCRHATRWFLLFLICSRLCRVFIIPIIIAASLAQAALLSEARIVRTPQTSIGTHA